MKKALILFCLALLFSGVRSQVAINTSGNSPVASAMLEVTSTDKGMLVPRMTTSQRIVISSPATGLLVFDTTTGGFWFYNGSAWEDLSSGLSSELADTDGDTKIQLEETVDEDKIRFDMGGKEYFRMSDGRFEIVNSGGSVFIGENAGLNDDLSNNQNVFVGKNAGYLSVTGGQNIAMGSGAFTNNIGGQINIAIGAYSLYTNSSAWGNIAIGLSSLYFNTTGAYNTALGTRSLMNNITGHSNVAIGSRALYSNTNKNNLVAVGDSALYNNGIGASGSQAKENTAVGSKSMFENTTGFQNTAMGFQSLYSNTTGNKNTASGYHALHSNSSGFNNSAYGHLALNGNTSGKYNTSIGVYSLYSNTVGSENSAFGSGAIEQNTEGNENAAFGFAALYSNTTGNYNVGIGKDADYYNQTGSNNTIVGYQAGRNSTSHSKSGNIFIGHKAGYSEASSNKLYIQNSDTTRPLIYGDFDNKMLGINALKTGIGTQSPMGKLHIHDINSSNTTIYITPKSTSANDSSTVFFAEDHNATYGMYWMYDGTNNQMELWGKSNLATYGPHLLVERNSGNIAIGGDFASGYMLSVGGKVACEEVKVFLKSSWPDYVFSSDYNLMSIKKLDEFVKTNNHLPNIPSAKDIEKSGLEMGEMQRKMMEKIEELSLYIISLQEQIDELSTNQK